jgi:very-short-patch-repair endonuclease
MLFLSPVAESLLAIELDGPQRLADPEAYRRDRRKDFLLQENGYLVLRCLAEDVGARLSHVLDTITRALATRARRHREICCACFKKTGTS